MVYDDRHRNFLQAIMQGGAVLDQDASALCLKIFNGKTSVPTVAELINEKLNPIAMVMKAGICELTGDKYWSVVGTAHEEALTIPSEFTNAQRAFLRAIYAEVINAEDGCISSTDCLNLSNTIDVKLAMGDADKFLKTVVRRKWLHYKDGYIYIGVRSIVELMPYFRATYMDNFHNCSLCREVVFSGQKCQNENCEAMYHSYCLAKYTAVQKQNKCPKCKNSWDDIEIPDEVLRSQALQNDTEDENMDVTNDPELSQTNNTQRRSKKRRRIHEE